MDRNGKTRKYYPDFYLSQHNIWVEIKGKRYIRPDDNLRLAAVGNIICIFSNELKDPNILQKVLAPHPGYAPSTSARQADMIASSPMRD